MSRIRVYEGENSELTLPEGIIQKIQSNLSLREAVRSSIMGAEWLTAWRNHPTFRLIQPSFRSIGEFSDFAAKCLKRYSESDLKPLNFTLVIDYLPNNSTVSLIHEIIIQSLRLGVECICLTFPDEESLIPGPVILPTEVFLADKLIDVSLVSCKLRLYNNSVSWCQLTSLYLSKVDLRDTEMSGILMGCPVMQKIDLYWCEGHRNVVLYQRTLRRVRIINCSTRLQYPLVVFQSDVVFGNMENLELRFVETLSSFFNHFARKFPHISRVRYEHCKGLNEQLDITSKSLRYLCVESGEFDGYKRVYLQLTSLRDFHISCWNIPELSSKTDLQGCNSEIELISCGSNASAEFFLELKQFVTELKHSVISLNVNDHRECILPEGFLLSSKPIEHMKLGNNFFEKASAYMFLSGLFSCCQPKFLTLSGFQIDVLMCLYKSLLHNVVHKEAVSTHNPLFVPGLDKVILEYKEADDVEWNSGMGEDELQSWYNLRPTARLRFRLCWQD